MILTTNPRFPSVFLTNARSVFPKMDELRLTVLSLRADVVIVTESWLNNDLNDELLTLSNFDIFRCDRYNKRGGGVCMWVNPSFKPRLLSSTTAPSFIEVSSVVFFCAGIPIICCGLYVPPGLCKSKHDDIVEYLFFQADSFLSTFPDGKIMIAGDLNDFKMDPLCENFCLLNCVHESTRKDAILDQIWFSESLCDFYEKSATVGPPLRNSDHNCVFLSSLCRSQYSESRRLVHVWDYRESNIVEYLNRLSCTDFSSIADELTVDSMCCKFYEMFSACLFAVPCEPVFFSSSDKPWVTPILKLLINKRWAAFRERNWPLYQHYKEKVKIEIVKAKRIWCDKQTKSPRGLWNIVRTMCGSRERNGWQTLLEDHGGIQRLLEKLTDEFAHNFNSSADSDLLPLSEQEWDFSIPPTCVFQELTRLHIRKATGPDHIPPKLLKIGAQFLCYPLASIFNKSLQTQTFPCLFKHAHVCPVPKKPSPRLSDFRPISLLSVMSKVFERIVLNHIKTQLISCYGPGQHAYRPLASTTTALTELCEYVSRALDCESTTSVNIFCVDLSRAFDMLQHNRLINYLNEQGLNHGCLRWLYSYLSSRILHVKVMNDFGPLFEIPSGVPQGSVLGPFLFAAYMGSFDFNSCNVHCLKYADDVLLIETISRDSAPTVSFDHCESVLKSKGFVVNQSKCKVLRVCRSRTHFTASNTGFSEVASVKILGVVFVNNLKWHEQVSAILRTAAKRLYAVRLMKNVVPAQKVIQVYHALITSLFLYASPVYGNLPVTVINKLEKFQRRAHRIICGPYCECAGFPSLQEKFEISAVCLLLKAEAYAEHPLHCLLPSRMPASRLLRMPSCTTSRRLNSFLPWAIHLCNSRLYKCFPPR